MSTSSDDLEIVQDLIRFCPLCGYESTKEFNDYIESGGDWVCENCEEIVEAYLIPTDEDEDDQEEEKYTSSLLLWLVLVIIVGVYFFI